MRNQLKHLACLALTASLTLGTCLTSFANTNAAGGGNQGVLTGTPGNGKEPNGATFSTDACGLGFRLYLCTFGDLIHDTSPDSMLTSFAFNATSPAESATTLDDLAEKNNCVYLVSGNLSRNIKVYDQRGGGFKAVPAERVYTLDQVHDMCGKHLGERGFTIYGTYRLDSVPGYAQALDDTFGDCGGKLTSLLQALSKFETGAKEFAAEVKTDATDPYIVKLLSEDEVIEQFEHYINWWEEVFSWFPTYPSNAISLAKMKDEFKKASSTAKTIAEAKAVGPGVSTQALDSYTKRVPEFMNYPCIVIEPVAFVQHANTGTVPAGVTFAHVFADNGAKTGCFGGSGYGSPLGYGQPACIGRSNKGNNHWASTGCLYQVRVFDKGDIECVPFGLNSGYLFYGYYGNLVFNTFIGGPKDPGDPETPPPEVPDETPNDPEVDGDLADFLLMDYEINHVFDSIAEKLRKGNGSHTWMKLGTNQATVNGQVRRTVDCAGDHGPWDDYDTTKYYDVDYQENAGSGPSISMDNAGTKLFLKNNGKYGDTWFYRDEIKAGQTLDSRNVADYTVDYAFNLLRRHFKDADGKPDNRIYSLLVEQKVTKEYLDNVLGMYEGMMPKDIAEPVERRDSTARLRAIQDSTSWTSKFNVTGRQVAYDTESKSHSSRYHDGCDDCSGHSCHASWNALKDGPALQGYVVGGSGYAEYSWDIISLAHKYRTVNIPMGFVNPQPNSFDYRETEDVGGSDSVPEGEQYRSASQISTSTNLEYYPEVPMLGDEVPGPDLTHEYKPIITIGEEKRKTRTPMLLLYRLESASPDVTGTVYTDTAVGGSSYLGTNKVALTAGGDFTVKADTKMTINLYGYAMDIIEPSDPSYAEVTRSNDVKAAWGDMSNNRADLLNTYTQWAGVMLNPNSYQADFEMLSGGKKYNSFSATVGGFTTRASNSKEEGSYPLVFKHGDIDKTAQGYKDFIKQLAQDYACSEAEADALFEASEMKQAVIKSIEHDNSSENKSQAQTIGRDQVQLGSSSHWYDEEVRTIVMRRFMTPQGTFKDIIAQDKMDIGNAMEGNAIQNGQFRLTLWFDAGVYTKTFDSVYKPSTGSSNKDAKLDDGNIILCGVHVSGADFQLTRSTTATGKH